MIALGNKSTDTSERKMEEQSNGDEKRYIYFNPNFCINNINVKELVSRAEKSTIATSPEVPMDTSSQPKQTPSVPMITNHTAAQPSVPEIPKPPIPNRKAPADSQPRKPALLPTPRDNPFKVPPARRTISRVTRTRQNFPRPGPSQTRKDDFCESKINWNDRNHPWYPYSPHYASNLLSLATDYSIRPNQPPRCRLPPLSKKELHYRMEKLYIHGKLSAALKLPSLIDKFVKYMKIMRDQMEFDHLQIDYTNKHTYAECRRKRALLNKLNVNKFHYVNESAAEELYARCENLRGYKKQIRKNLDLSKVDTSKLSPRQRKFLFFHHVFKQGKRVYVNEKVDSETATSPKLVSINKYKAVSKSNLITARKLKIRKSLRYRRSEDPFQQDCRFFIKTGKCKFGIRCIRKHDPSKLPAGLKKAAARKRPQSTFKVNNIKLPRRPNMLMPPPLVPISSLKSVPTASTAVSTSSTPAPATITPTAVSVNTIQSSNTSSFKTDYRFINNPTLGPTKVALNKKLVNRALRWKRMTALRKKQDCMFFIRRGKCAFGEECRKKHDPNKVALCSKFIFTNHCNNSQCRYQHKLIKEKMPLCLYFYVGKCSKDTCPFLHVKMGTDVPVCEKFSAGHCDKGSMCTKRHTRDCETHFEKGVCMDEDCKLLHEKILRRRSISFSSIENAMDIDRPYFDGDDFIPIGGRIEDTASPDILRMLESDVESIAGSIAGSMVELPCNE